MGKARQMTTMMTKIVKAAIIGAALITGAAGLAHAQAIDSIGKRSSRRAIAMTVPTRACQR